MAENLHAMVFVSKCESILSLDSIVGVGRREKFENYRNRTPNNNRLTGSYNTSCTTPDLVFAIRHNRRHVIIQPSPPCHR